MEPIDASEGVIRFELVFSATPPVATSADLAELSAWRGLLYRMGLTGHDPKRYGGLAYGNVSVRWAGDSFIISGTQTGGNPWLTPRDYCLVDAWDFTRNRVSASGPIRPSSEALTHAALYAARPDVRCVLHIHSPELWRWSDDLSIPRTAPDILYGTVAMAQAIHDLARLTSEHLICMGGHEDGLIAFGHDVEETALYLVSQFTRALSRTYEPAAYLHHPPSTRRNSGKDRAGGRHDAPSQT